MVKLTIDRRAVLRRVRNTSIAILILLVLLVGAGVAYSFYTASLAKDQPLSTAPELEERQEIVPTKPNPVAQVGVATSTLEVPAAPGENVLFSIRTNAEATCDIVVTYGERGEIQNQSQDSGLKRKVADAFGVISWTWTVEPSRPLGEWPIEVNCFNEVNTGYLRAKLLLTSE